MPPYLYPGELDRGRSRFRIPWFAVACLVTAAGVGLLLVHYAH